MTEQTASPVSMEGVREVVAGDVVLTMNWSVSCVQYKIKGNFKDKYRRRGGDEALICDDCDSEEIQTPNHCLECPNWEDLRRGIDVTKIDDLLIYFQQMLTERLKRKFGSSG